MCVCGGGGGVAGAAVRERVCWICEQVGEMKGVSAGRQVHGQLARLGFGQGVKVCSRGDCAREGVVDFCPCGCPGLQTVGCSHMLAVNLYNLSRQCLFSQSTALYQC